MTTEKGSNALGALIPVGLWLSLTTLLYFLEPDIGPKYYETIPFLIFYGRSLLLLLAFAVAIVASVYLAKFYKNRQIVMGKLLADEKSGEVKLAPSQRAARALQSIFFIGIMPISLGYGTYEIIAYLERYDTSEPIFKKIVPVIIVGVVSFLAFVFGVGLTGRKINLSDQGLFGQVFGRTVLFIFDTIILAVIIFLMRSCSG